MRERRSPNPATREPAAPSVGVVGAARVLALVYGFFTLAAGARSGVQLATRFFDAPVAYVLSAVAAAIYLLGTIVMLAAERNPARLPLARGLCLTELSGVVTIGTASVVFRGAFPDATVWSGFGVGYAFVPVALPLCALAWTYRASTPPVTTTSGRELAGVQVTRYGLGIRSARRDPP